MSQRNLQVCVELHKETLLFINKLLNFYSTNKYLFSYIPLKHENGKVNLLSLLMRMPWRLTMMYLKKKLLKCVKSQAGMVNNI